MKRRYSGFLLTLALMFAVILGFIPGLETAMTVHAEEESETSEESSETEGVIASGTCGENLTWTLENGTLTISGTGEMYNYLAYIDDETYEVWAPWLDNVSKINRIVIEDGVTGIGAGAFYQCRAAKTITIPTTVSFISMGAFSYCDSLEEVYIDSFEAWLEVEFATSSSNPLWNGADLYINGVIVDSIIIPEEINELQAYAFAGAKLSSVTFEGNVPDIHIDAFYGCDSIKAVYVDSIEAWFQGEFVNTFSNPLWNGADLYIDGVVVDWATLVIPDEIEVLPAYVFCGINCVTITIPDSVTEIGEGCFSNCVSLENVTIPDSVTEIGRGCFSGCTSLESVTISDSVTNIDDYCFYGCEKLKSVELSSNLVEISANAFDGCINLESVTLPVTLESIYSESFRNCEKIQSITIPASVTYIGSEAFNGCDNLKQIYFEGGAPSLVTYYSNVNGDFGPGSGERFTRYGSFYNCTAIAYYPQSNTTWTKEVLETNYGGKVTWIGYESDLTTPSKPYKIANVVSGVHVYWNAVSDATKYGLWRSETGANGSYKWMGNPTTNHFTDTKVESGKTYYYCVSTCNPKTNAHSIISEPLGITYVSTPDITNRMNLAAGVKLTWNKINGATGYAIYRKPYTGNAAWTRVTTISGNETFTWTDKTVASANGSLYRYTIRALAGTNMKTLSGCRNTGRTMARLTSRTMNSVTKTAATSVKCTWTTTAQASGYEVRFMNGNTVVKQFTVGNYKTGAKTFTGIPAGANYKVQVRSYKKVDGVGAFYSAWSTPKYVNL